MAFLSQRMLSTKTRYKIYDGKILAIVETFKTLKYYLEDFQHEVLVLTDYNNFQWFMDIKSLISK